MSVIKEIREQLGYTQVMLAEKTSLSLRTIQRLEASNKTPKGHTLKVLSNVLDIEPLVLQKKYNRFKENKNNDLFAIKMINLSVLAFFVVPFGNIIFPIILWRKKRQSSIIDEFGRKIINVQLIWSIILSILLLICPLINSLFFTSLPLILIVLLIAVLINVFIVLLTSRSLKQHNLNYLNFPLKLI